MIILYIYIYIYFKYKILTIKILKLYLIKKFNWSSTHISAQYAKNVVSYVTWIEVTLSMIELTLAQDVLFLSSS